MGRQGDAETVTYRIAAWRRWIAVSCVIVIGIVSSFELQTPALSWAELVLWGLLCWRLIKVAVVVGPNEILVRRILGTVRVQWGDVLSFELGKQYGWSPVRVLVIRLRTGKVVRSMLGASSVPSGVEGAMVMVDQLN